MAARRFFLPCPLRTGLALSASLLLALSAGCGSGLNLSTSPQTIGGLNTITTLSSTIDSSNGDTMPYGLAIAPVATSTFTADGVSGHIQPGDVVVSNFANSSGSLAAGTTVEDVASGHAVRLAAEPSGFSGPDALAFNSTSGDLWIENLGVLGQNPQGGLQVYTAHAAQETSLQDPSTLYGWGLVSNQGYGGKTCFFAVNAKTGQIVRINVNVSGSTTTYTYDILSASLGQVFPGANGVPLGPTALVHGPDDTLYIANSYSNFIFAIPASSTIAAASDLSNVIYIYNDTTGKYLDEPVGMAMNPINNDLILANRLNNTIVEINPSNKQVISVKTVDSTPVQSNGTGAALAGIAAATDTSGNLKVYFTDQNDNTVKVLSK